MRESTLLLGYTAQPGVDAVPMQHHQVSQVIVRRTRLSHRRGSGRVTLKRSFALEDHLLSATATATATNVEMEERKASVEDASVSFQFQQSKPSKNVYQSKRRTRILDRKAGSGRSTSLRLFPLESKEMSPKVLSPEERATNNLCLEIVPYNDNQRAMELDAYASPDAGGFADHEPCFEDVLDASVMQEEEMQEEHVLHEAAAAAAAPVPVSRQEAQGRAAPEVEKLLQEQEESSAARPQGQRGDWTEEKHEKEGEASAILEKREGRVRKATQKFAHNREHRPEVS
eukprot:CAMPEP_0197474166 /NCGR_PEP_ID=MMETSP1309-20131121/5608_1 /TAXON_ID=464262 /ORGANISM="Genus nov. species nov., Strain RCC998" /LENGTH=285 /DNA_ID=CAMNT_0043013675 /DNA_START=36 /DNA_END=892 /DNA_ORIENTATION=-